MHSKIKKYVNMLVPYVLVGRAESEVLNGSLEAIWRAGGFDSSRNGVPEPNGVRIEREKV